MTRVCHSIEDLLAFCKDLHLKGETLALVPTMGALHEGHLSLIHMAKKAAKRVIVTIFINPIQFNKADDYNKYPRTLEEDLLKLSGQQVDLVFCPTQESMYPNGYQTFTDNSVLSLELEGASRPGHFKGVCTVVLKLFNLIRPNVAVFGKKDYQQFQIVSQMVHDLNLDITMLGAPIIRESDGLAMSSRNVRLNSEERKIAPTLYQGLNEAHKLYKNGVQDLTRLTQCIKSHISSQINIDYIEFRGFELEPVPKTQLFSQGIVLAAVYLGDVRLIDNMEFI